MAPSQIVGDAVAFLAAHGGLLLIGTTGLLAAGAVAARLQRSPLHRQRLCELTVAATVVWVVLACVPMRRWLQPAEAPPERPQPVVPAPAAMPAGRLYLADLAAVAAPLELPDGPAAVDVESSPTPASAIAMPAMPGPRAEPFDAARFAAGAYGIGAAAAGAWLLLGGVLLAVIVCTARPAPHWVQAQLGSLCEGGPRARLLVSARCRRPFSCGVFRATVVLPEALTVPENHGRLRQVLLHELAHVRQRDAWGNALLNLALPLLWFHPLYWLLRHDAHLARELVADDWAASRSGKACYVAELVAMARSTLARPAALGGPLGSVALFRSPTNFYRRMHMLMQRTELLATSCSRGWKVGAATAAAAVLLIAAGVAGLEPARAQDRPSEAVPGEAEVRQRDADALKVELDAARKALDVATQRLQQLQQEAEAAKATQQLREVELKARLDQLAAEKAAHSDAQGRGQRLDEQVARKLLAEGLKRSETTDDEFARRLYLDVVGVPPEPEALNRFRNDNTPDKRARLLEELLRKDPARANAWKQWAQSRNNAAAESTAARSASADGGRAGGSTGGLGHGQLDLVTLALSYIDATGDLQTARARLERIAKLPDDRRSDLGVEEGKVAVVTAERKVRLLRGVIEIALTGAKSEYDQARQLADRGLVSRSEVSDAEAKLQILELILKSGQ